MIRLMRLPLALAAGLVILFLGHPAPLLGRGWTERLYFPNPGGKTSHICCNDEEAFVELRRRKDVALDVETMKLRAQGFEIQWCGKEGNKARWPAPLRLGKEHWLAVDEASSPPKIIVTKNVERATAWALDVATHFSITGEGACETYEGYLQPANIRGESLWVTLGEQPSYVRVRGGVAPFEHIYEYRQLVLIAKKETLFRYVRFTPQSK